MKNFSCTEFGRRLSGEAGIVALMEDLGDALNVNPDLLFLGGGNPAAIPEVESALADELAAISADPDRLHRMLGIYQSPRGQEAFLDAFAGFLNQRCGWSVGRENLALSNGSQSAFFILMNMLAGEQRGRYRRIHLPMAPEYLGYADQMLADDLFVAHRPLIEFQDDSRFKYRIDFNSLNDASDMAAICASVPTNPTGNIPTHTEICELQKLAADKKVPLILDCAYGAPLPDIVYGDVELPWHQNTLYTFSLSKLGLPGARTGILVGQPELISQFVAANTIVSLANGNLGPSLVAPMLRDGRIQGLIDNAIKPFYRQRRDWALAFLQHELAGLPCWIHRADGAFFLWLWLEGLPISSATLYKRLKDKGVLIMPGEPFFFGLHDRWAHRNECIRLSYCQDEKVLERAIAILGEEVREAYR